MVFHLGVLRDARGCKFIGYWEWYCSNLWSVWSVLYCVGKEEVSEEGGGAR